MNWITKIIKAGEKIKTVFHERASKADQEASLWTSCTCLNGPMLKTDLEANLFVCPSCNKHHRIKPSQRFDILFGKNNYEIMDTPQPVDDPLGFVDSMPYKQRLKNARKKTGLKCSMVVSTGSINNIPITAIASDFDFMGASIGAAEGEAFLYAAQHARKKTGLKCSMVVSTGSINNIPITAIASDFDFMGASMGAAEGEAFLFAAQHAIENKQPLIMVATGGGMKMQESLISLSQMTRTTLAINEVKAAGLPYIVVMADPVAGGITASYAMLGSLHIAEPGALVAFAGARVIKGTVKEDLPEGFQKSEYVQKTGFIDLIVERKDLASKIGILLSILLKKNSAISSEQNETSEDTQQLSRAAS